MTRDTVIQSVAACVIALSLGASMLLTPAIAASAGRHRLVYTDTAEASESPMVALGVAFGAFRGLFVNYLWIRANEMKEAGNYYEAVDLANAITKLQPRFPRVWAFHAWNLAYNISVATKTDKERWQWVQAGIRLLRDQGLRANPNDLLLHRELAWIFLHKVQGVMDDANQYYKRQFAREWQIVLGPPPARVSGEGGTQKTIDAFAEKLDRIARAPDSLEGVFEQFPQAREIVQKVREVASIDVTDFTPQSRRGAWGLLEFAEERRSAQRMQQATGLGVPLGERQQKLLDMLADPGNAEAVRTLLNHLRKRTLIDVYNMEPERMARFTRRFGPMDWRHAAAHAAYWSARGVEESQLRITDANRDDFDFVNTDRITLQAVQDLWRSGELYFDLLNDDMFMQMPSADFLMSYKRILDDAAAREQQQAAGKYNPKARVYNMYAAGYENFMKDAARFLYRRGDRAGAERYLDELRAYPELNDNNPAVVERLSLPIDEFVVAELSDNEGLTRPDVARAEIFGALNNAFIGGLLGGDARMFEQSFDYAKRFHEIFTRKQVFTTDINKGAQGRLEVMDRDFRVFSGRVLAGLIQHIGLPDGAIVYSRAPADLRLATYGFLVDMPLAAALNEAGASGGAGFEGWFPPPPGYTPVVPTDKAGPEPTGARKEVR
jgi:hypothetical protein